MGHGSLHLPHMRAETSLERAPSIIARSASRAEVALMVQVLAVTWVSMLGRADGFKYDAEDVESTARYQHAEISETE